MRSGGWDRSARDARSVPVFDTGASVAGPGGSELPVLVSPLVDARFGPTAAFGIPAVDEADRDARRADRARPELRGAGRGRGGARRRAPRRRPGRGRPRGQALPRQRLLDLAPALLGHADPGHPLRGAAAPCRCPRRTCRWCCRATSSRPARATRWPSAPTSSTSPAPRCGAAGQARDRHPRLPLRRALALGPGRGAARRPRRADVQPPRPAGVAAGRAPRRRRRQRWLRLRPARSSPRRCATSAPSPSSRTASRSPAASSTRW